MELIIMERRRRRAVRSLKRRNGDLQSLSGLSEVALRGDCALFINVRQFAGDVEYSMIKQRGELSLLSHVFASFLFVFLNILICASVYVKRKKGEGFVSVQKLSMIHVSSALICELCTAPG